MSRDWYEQYRIPAGGSGDEPASFKDRLLARRKSIIITVLLVGGLAFAAGWNPPTDTVHKFTEASDFSVRRESGCTNSGEGCHGEDADLSNFNRYHPETDCKVCHEYTGVGCIPCHGPQQYECTGCHDGSMEGASDCVRLSDPYPKGHYRVKLHAATGTDMAAQMVAAPGGSAKAACSNCHSKDLKDAHAGVPQVEGSDYGPEIGCAECHNDKKSGALEQVLDKWKKHRCEDCHGEKSQAPMHATDVAAKVEATGADACGSTGAGCHENTDLHALHPNAPATCGGSAVEGEPGCHDLNLQSVEPTVTACGSGDGTCHAPYRNNAYGHENDASVHRSGPQAGAVLTDAMSGVSLTCGSCHSSDLTAEHRRPSSGGGAGTCGGCHNKNASTIRAVRESWPGRETKQACAACHGSKHDNIGSTHTAVQLDADGTVSTNSCVKSGCHNTADVRVLHAGAGCTLGGCHSSTGNISGSIMTCGGTSAQSGTSCHTGASMAHSNSTVSHSAVELADDGSVKPGSCARSGCHPTTDVRSLHETTGSCGTFGCHTTGGPTYMTCGGAPDTATSCHVSGSRHDTYSASHNGDAQPDANACMRAGCHTTIALDTLHAAKGCNVTGCHDTTSVRPTNKTCGGVDGSGSCHVQATLHPNKSTLHAAIELDGNGVPQPGACNCHFLGTDPIDVRSIRNGLPTMLVAHGCTDTPGCHVTGGPYSTTCGGNNPAIGCHSGGTIGGPLSASCVLPTGSTSIEWRTPHEPSAAPAGIVGLAETPATTETAPADAGAPQAEEMVTTDGCSNETTNTDTSADVCLVCHAVTSDSASE